MNFNDILWILLSVITISLGVTFVKQYTITNNYLYMVGAIVLYTIALVCYVKIFKESELASMYQILQILIVLVIIPISIYMYDEKFTTRKIIGILFAITTIILLT